MSRAALVAALLLGGTALASDDAPRALPADAAVVWSARPLAVVGAVTRLGRGWPAFLRRLLWFPDGVDVLDPARLQALGVDPAASLWGALRGAQGLLQLRLVVPLSDPQRFDALVQRFAAGYGSELTQTPHGWTGKVHELPLLARLDGTVLVADVVLSGSAPAPTAFAQLLPLRPPRPWRPRGLAARFGPTDAIAAWADLAAVGAMGLLADEARLAEGLRGVGEASLRAQLLKAGRAEHATCRAALRMTAPMFDDALLALSVAGPDALRLTAALGGRAATLAAWHGPRRAKATAPDDVDVRAALVDGRSIRAVLATSGAERAPHECGQWGRLALTLRHWPAAEPRSPSEELIAVAEVDDGVRGDVDRLAAQVLTATAPLHAGGRQLTAYAPPRFPWSDGEGPLLVVDTLPAPAGGALVLWGARERLRAFVERGTAVASTPPADGTLATGAISARGLDRLFAAARGDALPAELRDGLARLDAALRIEGAELRLVVDAALAPRAAP